ncbi:MAG: hypothetical protein PHD02_02420 [Bacilli bacterium]|nr:hypothetical protein [Bacilli bacterium]
MLDIKKRNKKTFIVYLITSVIFYIIVQLYYQHSHNVTSVYMTYFYLTPLLGMTTFLILIKTKKPSRISYNLYNASIFTFALGFLTRGIIEIAGTESGLIYIFNLVGFISLLLSIVTIKSLTFKNKVL